MAGEEIKLGRRGFTQRVAVGALAAAVGACGADDASLDGDTTEGGSGGSGGSGADGVDDGIDAGSDGPSTSASATGDTAGDDGAPVWTSVPAIQFVEGVASEVSIAEYVSDPDDDPLMVMLNDVELPAGVTFDAAGMRFVYDGSGPVATTNGHVLTADDGTA